MKVAMRERERALQSREAVELVADKWRITVLHLLRDGALRTGTLQAAMPQVSAKMLTQTLRRMERDGLVLRRAAGGRTQRVDYELTPMGYSLLGPLGELCRWAKAHTAERDAARERFRADARSPTGA